MPPELTQEQQEAVIANQRGDFTRGLKAGVTQVPVINPPTGKDLHDQADQERLGLPAPRNDVPAPVTHPLHAWDDLRDWDPGCLVLHDDRIWQANTITAETPAEGAAHWDAIGGGGGAGAAFAHLMEGVDGFVHIDSGLLVGAPENLASYRDDGTGYVTDIQGGQIFVQTASVEQTQFSSKVDGDLNPRWMWYGDRIEIGDGIDIDTRIRHLDGGGVHFGGLTAYAGLGIEPDGSLHWSNDLGSDHAHLSYHAGWPKMAVWGENAIFGSIHLTDPTDRESGITSSVIMGDADFVDGNSSGVEVALSTPSLGQESWPAFMLTDWENYTRPIWGVYPSGKMVWSAQDGLSAPDVSVSRVPTHPALALDAPYGVYLTDDPNLSAHYLGLYRDYSAGKPGIEFWDGTHSRTITVDVDGDLAIDGVGKIAVQP